MFERRVKIVLLILLGCAIVVFARLIDLQVIHADEYRQHAADALLLQPRTLPFVRGRILDRTGRLLVSDEPTWDVKIDYGVLADDPTYLAARAGQFRESGRYGAGLEGDAVADALRAEIDHTWLELSRFTGRSEADLQQTAFEVCERIDRVRQTVARRRGFDAPIAEERMAHTIAGGLDDQRQIDARAAFGRYPWVTVEAATHRRYHQAECLAHVLGQVGPVDAEQMENDPWGDDDLRCYRGDELAGVSGVEHAAEDLLRGWRGQLHRDRQGRTLEDVKPQPGRDVHLTIRYDLQERLYELLAAALPKLPYSPGGTVVVLDVPSRDILALVSYPAYDPNHFREPDTYARLRADAVHMPLRFRALANRYPPGSVIKPLTCLAGLSSGAITLDTRIDCTGYLYPDRPEMSGTRCWQISGTDQRMAHGSVNVVEAIEGSCNVFMYTVGVRVGVDGLTSFFDIVGFGRSSGTQLREENRGINPTPAWLQSELGASASESLARQYSIGQGEVAATPLQVANVMATYAAGAYRPVRLVRERDDAPTWELPLTPAHGRAIREGLFRVVNSPEGTAYKYARLSHPSYAVAGKTGSATAEPRPVAFEVPYRTETGSQTVAIIPAGSRREAIEEFQRLHPKHEPRTSVRADDFSFDPANVRMHAEWPPIPPPEGGEHAHAWFAGYLQRIDSAGQPLLDVQPRIAFAVLVEYGGSGGRTSGPIARQVAEIIIQALGDDLDPDAAVATLGPSS